MSLSGCLPNLVMWIPRIQMSSLSHGGSHVGRSGVGSESVSDRFEAEADGLGAVVVGAERVRGQRDLHAERDVLGVGLDVDDVAAHARAVAVDDAGHERHRRRPGAAKATIVNVRTSPSVAIVDRRGTRCRSSAAQALRRSKKRAPQVVHSLATRWGSPSPSTR